MKTNWRCRRPREAEAARIARPRVTSNKLPRASSVGIARHARARLAGSRMGAKNRVEAHGAENREIYGRRGDPLLLARARASSASSRAASSRARAPSHGAAPAAAEPPRSRRGPAAASASAAVAFAFAAAAAFLRLP